MTPAVHALAVRGGDLYAGGVFGSAGGVSADCIAKWDGSSWSALGTGVNGIVSALVVKGDDLFAGGSFATAGSTAANGVAKWNGSSWSALGGGFAWANERPAVIALTVIGGDLYAGGYFDTAGQTSASCIAQWDGSSWSALGAGMGGRGEIGGAFDGPHICALAAIGSDLFAGGWFKTAGETSANGIAKWDGSSWLPLGTGGNGLDGRVSALAVMGTDLFAGGSFTMAGGATANCIAKWDGSSWSPLGTGMELSGAFIPSVPGPDVQALVVMGRDLYAGGYFSTAGGVSANNIAKWDGMSWSALGTGMNADVSALAVMGTDLFAGGAFTTAGSAAANRIAKWDGSSWSALGTGFTGGAHSISPESLCPVPSR